MSVTSSKNLGIGIAAIAIAIVSIIIASISLIDLEVETEEEDEEEQYRPVTREAFLFTEVDEHIDEEALAIPPDMFSQDTIVVHQGDKVRVHFYNLEPVETRTPHIYDQ